MLQYKVISLACVVFIVTAIIAYPLDEEQNKPHLLRRLRRQRRPIPTPRTQNPSSIGYMVRCQDVEESPGVYNYNCHGAPEDKITLNLEHAVQFQRGSGSGRGRGRSSEPQTLNIIVPNYKIRQIIQPEIIGRELDGGSGSPAPVNVNILLEKPKIFSERRRQKEIQFDKQEKTTTTTKPPSPQVNVHYEKVVGDKNKEYEFVNPSLSCADGENCENKQNQKKAGKEGQGMKAEDKNEKDDTGKDKSEKGNPEKDDTGKDKDEKSKHKDESQSDSKKPTDPLDDETDPRRQDLDMDYQPIEVSEF